MGITYGSAIQVYYLLAIYTFLCTAAMFAFTGTPLGRMLNAVRDNPERVEFIGYEMQRVRYIAFIIAGFFAGVAGGMYAHELRDRHRRGRRRAARSGAYLLFTFLGGATVFFGPIIGAILMVLAFVLLSEFTKAWLLYLGLIFLFMVMYAPGGIASLILMNLRVAALRQARPAGPALPRPGRSPALPMLVGAAALIEMIYHLQLDMAARARAAFPGPVAQRAIGGQLDRRGRARWWSVACCSSWHGAAWRGCGAR